MISIDYAIADKVKFIHSVLVAKRYVLHINRILALTTAFILAVIAVECYKVFKYKAVKSSFYFQLVTMKDQAIVDYAVTGIWPSISIPVDERLQQDEDIIQEQMSTDDGDYQFSYNIPAEQKHYTESYRLVQHDQRQPSLYWLCGHSQPRSDELVGDAYLTNSPVELLARHCYIKRNPM